MGVLTSGGKPLLFGGKVLTAGSSGSTSPAPTAIAAAVALIGQSNMEFFSDSTASGHYYSTDNRARRSVGGQHYVVGASDPTGKYQPGSPAFGAGGWAGDPVMVTYGDDGDGVATFVNAFTATANTGILTYEYAQRGTSIQQWMSDATSGNMWTPFASAVQADSTGLNSAIWLQGENNLSTTKADYKGYLRRLHDQLLALSGKAAADFYFGVVILGPGTTYGPEGSMAVIRQAQLEYIAENVGAYMAGVATDADLNGDAIHFTEASQAVMGARYAKALALFSIGTPAKWIGPRITGATRSGNTITVTTSGGIGSLKDGAGGSGSAVLGFRVFDNGAAATISATAVSGSSVVLTLAAAPSGTLTLDYGMANAPFGGTTNPASVLYDSDAIPRSTLGNPLIPCAAITVT